MSLFDRDNEQHQAYYEMWGAAMDRADARRRQEEDDLRRWEGEGGRTHDDGE